MRLHWISLMVATFASVVPVQGQDEQESNEGQVDERVTVVGEGSVEPPMRSSIATKLEVPLVDTPASISVVSSSLFNRQKGDVLGDALRNISGINVQTGSGVYDHFFIRGFDSLSSSLVLTDGTQEPEVTFYNLYNIERIEVLKGPGAFLYGGNPLSGTVNLQRKKPVFDRFGKAGLSYGSFGSLQSTIDYGDSAASDRVAFRINGMFRESDGYRDNTQDQTTAINPSLSFKINDTQSLTIDAEYVDAQDVSDAGLPLLGIGNPLAQVQFPEDVPRERSYQSPLDTSDQTVQRLQLEYRFDLSSNVSIFNRTYYTRLEWLSIGTFFNGVFPSQTSAASVSRSLLNLNDDQEFTGNQLEVKIDFSTGPVTHKFLGGLEFVRQADRFLLDVGFLPDIDLYNPVETASDQFIAIPGQEQQGRTRADILAPYFVDHMRFGPNCQVFLGMRYDTIDYQDRQTEFTAKFDKLSPMFGFLWSATDSQSFYGNIGEAFSPPSTLVLREDRKPEESDQIEVGWKKNWLNQRLTTTFALFDLDKKNIAIPDDNGFTKQTGSQSSRGAEFELAANLTSGIHAYASYAYTDAELTEFTESVLSFADGSPVFLIFDRSGNRPAFAPQQLINLWIGKDFANGFSIGGGTRYMSDQYIAEDNAYSIDDVLTFDGVVSYARRGWSTSLNVKNLTDTEYETRGFGATSVIPAEPLTVFGKISFSF